jgi:DNA uptake protein ComE-like DNA-binding protein
MRQLNQQERLGIGAAAAVVLMLGVGSCAYSHGGVLTAGGGRPALAPVAQDGSPVVAEPLDLPAGGSDKATPTPPVSAAASVASAPKAVASPPSLVVHVVGAVKRPGVYRLKSGDRLVDAVRAAGGFTPGAQQEALNLADALRDADQLYIPRRGETGGGNSLAQSAGPGGASRTRSRRRSYVVRGTPPVLSPIRPIVLTPPRQMSPPVPAISYGLPGPMPAPVPAITVAPGATTAARVVVAAPTQGRVLGRPVVVEAEPPEEGAEDASPSAAAYFAPPTTTRDSRTGSAARGSSAPKKFKNPGDGIVSLNAANAAQLMQLPGVGESTAQKILQYRAQIGRFTAITQMMDVKCPLS